VVKHDSGLKSTESPLSVVKQKEEESDAKKKDLQTSDASKEPGHLSPESDKTAGKTDSDSRVSESNL
jgi:hypothetical protein